MPAFRVKLGANDLNCVDVLLNRTHSLIGRVLTKPGFLGIIRVSEPRSQRISADYADYGWPARWAFASSGSPPLALFLLCITRVFVMVK